MTTSLILSFNLVSHHRSLRRARTHPVPTGTPSIFDTPLFFLPVQVLSLAFAHQARCAPNTGANHQITNTHFRPTTDSSHHCALGYPNPCDMALPRRSAGAMSSTSSGGYADVSELEQYQLVSNIGKGSFGVISKVKRKDDGRVSSGQQSIFYRLAPWKQNMSSPSRNMR